MTWAEPDTAPRPFDVLDALHAHARAGIVAQALGALILGLAYFRHAPLAACALWTVGWLALCLMRWRALRGYRLRRAGDAAGEQRARAAWDQSNLLGGALWGMAAVLFFPPSDVPQQIGLAVLVCALSTLLPASSYTVYLITAALGVVPLMMEVMWAGTHGATLAAVLGLVVLSAALVARSYRAAFRHLFELKGEAERLAAQLAIEKRRAEEATASRSRFYTAASHDLRQPLQALLILGDSLQRKALAPDAAALAVRLLHSVRALESLFDGLLDIGQLEAGAVQPKLGPVRLEPLYQRIGLHWRPTAFDRGLSLDFRGGDQWVQADPVLLERVLRNLVANAVACTLDGGVLVTCRPRGAERCLLQVWDTGPGIPADTLPRVFEEFFRGPTAPSGAGLGLGLTIAQGFARLMGSGLAVRSTPGRGTVFSLLLPRAAPQASTPTRAVPALASLAQRRFVVLAAHLPAVDQVVEQLRLWHAQADRIDSPMGWTTTDAGPAPDVLVLGPLPVQQQQDLLDHWQRTWPHQPAAVLLIAPARHPAIAWPRLVRLSQPLAAHRLRAALIALGPSTSGSEPVLKETPGRPKFP